ncbi:MAG: septal ring lytic transglycosylase RlpA family protein [Solirubrobacteraceae bacterium]
MRPQRTLRARPLAALGALSVATAGTALAMPPQNAGSAVTPPAPVRATVKDRTLRYGQWLVVRGRVQRADAGSRAILQFAPRGGAWRAVAGARVRRDGRYRLVARLRNSGAVRVTLAAARGAHTAVPGGTRAAVPGGAAPAATAARASRRQRVSVAARIIAGGRVLAVPAGRRTGIKGRIAPGGRRLVLLEAGRAGRWRVVARDRAHRNGRFALRFRARPGTVKLRVRFRGDRLNSGATRRVGVASALRPSLASWYGIYGGPLACGGTLGYNQMGVANKSLPCGTRVTIRFRGRTVRVPVIDRGPYVGGREWDLTGATARALHFDGVGTVWVSP